MRLCYNIFCFLFSGFVANGFLFGTSFYPHSYLSSSSRSQSEAGHEKKRIGILQVSWVTLSKWTAYKSEVSMGNFWSHWVVKLPIIQCHNQKVVNFHRLELCNTDNPDIRQNFIYLWLYCLQSFTFALFIGLTSALHFPYIGPTNQPCTDLPLMTKVNADSRQNFTYVWLYIGLAFLLFELLLPFAILITCNSAVLRWEPWIIIKEAQKT